MSLQLKKCTMTQPWSFGTALVMVANPLLTTTWKRRSPLLRDGPGQPEIPSTLLPSTGCKISLKAVNMNSVSQQRMKLVLETLAHLLSLSWPKTLSVCNFQALSNTFNINSKFNINVIANKY